MISVKEVVEWVENDIAFLTNDQSIEARKLLVSPQQITLEHGRIKGLGLIVACRANQVAYFDEVNDEFAIGRWVEGKVEHCELYGDFRYAVQALFDGEESAS